jgi:hypothetical protein
MDSTGETDVIKTATSERAKEQKGLDGLMAGFEVEGELGWIKREKLKKGRLTARALKIANSE